MIKVPTITELNDRIAAGFRSRLNLPETEMKEVLAAASAVLAGELKMLYLFVDDIRNNLFPDTADLAEDGGELNRLGKIYLNRQPHPATPGIYAATLDGAEEGAILRSGLTFKALEGSKAVDKLFILETMYGVTDEFPVINIRALEGGNDSLLNEGDLLMATEPVVGFSGNVTVTEILVRPTNQELVTDYRKAVLDAIQMEPQGGSRSDYMLWSRDAPGVRRVYPYVKEAMPGTIEIYVEANPEDSEGGLGEPPQEILNSVIDVIKMDPDTSKPISERARKPMQAIIEVMEIHLIPVDVTIYGLTNQSIGVLNTIKKSISDYLFNVRPFIEAAELSRDRNDIITSGRIQSEMVENLPDGVVFESVDVSMDGETQGTYQLDRGRVPYLRNLNLA